jgi:hypothetical protein
MFLYQVKDFVRDGMEKAMEDYDDTKFSDALDRVQKEVLYCIMCTICSAWQMNVCTCEKSRLGLERRGRVELDMNCEQLHSHINFCIVNLTGK